MTPFLESAGWALMHFVWQGVAIAVLAAAALRLISRRSANVRYVIGCVALALMLAAPAVTMRLLWRANDAVAPGATSDEITAPAGERSRAADGTNAVQPRIELSPNPRTLRPWRSRASASPSRPATR